MAANSADFVSCNTEHLIQLLCFEIAATLEWQGHGIDQCAMQRLHVLPNAHMPHLALAYDCAGRKS